MNGSPIKHPNFEAVIEVITNDSKAHTDRRDRIMSSTEDYFQNQSMEIGMSFRLQSYVTAIFFKKL